MNNAATINLTLSSSTYSALKGSGYVLYLFRAVHASDASGVARVWRRMSQYGETAPIDIPNDLYAYTTYFPLGPNPSVQISSHAIRLGDTMQVSKDGTGQVLSTGPADSMTFDNTSDQPYSCGLATMSKPDPGKSGLGTEPYCAFPLHGHHQQRLMPSPQVLLQFSTASWQPGSIVGGLFLSDAPRVKLATGPGIMLQSEPDLPRDLVYDIDTGWDWKNADWAHSIAAGTDLTSLLILPFPSGGAG
jgi:hypothetical protein